MIKISIQNIHEPLMVYKLQSRGLTLNDVYQFNMHVFINHVGTLGAMSLGFNKLTNIINQNITVHLSNDVKFLGFVSGIKNLKQDKNGCYYEVQMQSPLGKLKYFSHNRIFTQKTVTEILRTVLLGYFLEQECAFFIGKVSKKIDQITQFEETDFEFFQRIIHRFRLSYFFDSIKNKVIISDSLSYFERGTTQTFDKSSTIQSKLIKGKKSYFSLLTHHLTDQVGHLAQLQTKPDSSWSSLFRIVQMSYFFDEEVLDFLSRSKIQAQLKLVPANQSCRSPCKGPKSQNFLIAHPSNSGPIDLDHQGRYRITYPDIQGQSKRIFKSQWLTGLRWGAHFPIHKNTKSLIYAENDDLDQPIIGGILTNNFSPNVVNRNNRTQFCIRSHLGHRMILEDKKGQESIQLKTASSNQEIILDRRRGFYLKNNTDSLRIATGSDLLFYAKRNFQEVVRHKKRIEIKQSYHLQSQKSNFQSSKMCFRAGKNLIFLANQMQICAKQVIRFHSKNMLLQGQRFSIKAENITLDAEELQNYGNIILQCGGSKMIINQNQVIIQGSLISKT